MRTQSVRLLGSLLVLVPGLAWAQTGTQPPVPPPATPPVIETGTDVIPAPGSLARVDFGVRLDSFTGDRARYNRFRDLRDGVFVDRFRLHKETGDWAAIGEAHHVGYRDQRFAGQFESFGRLKAGFIWDQIPLFISGDTRSLQRDLGGGVLGIDDSIQQAIQAGTLTLTNAIVDAATFDMRNRRHVAAFDMVYTATRDVDVIFKVKSTERKGLHLQSFGLLSSPGNGIAQELGVPMDQRTTDVKAMVEFANAKGMLAAGMTGSWFDNSIPNVQFDNPLRFTSISAGPSVGLVPMWPSNSSISFVANGSYKLPARTRALAAVSVGRASQDEALVPATSNTALVAPPLMRSTADARADILSMVYGLNSRPVENVWLNARVRYFDYDNKTPHFEAIQLVGDWSVGSNLWETEPLSVRNRSIDLDASFTPVNYLAFGIGYGRQDDKRTFRIFEDTAENIFRVSVDSTGNAYFTARLKYERSNRDGSGFDPHVLEEVDEQPDMRHYDVANRDRSRVTALVTLTPTPWLNVNGSVATGDDDYDDTGFGLRDNTNRAYGVGFDLMPLETVNLGVSYQREKYTSFQYSRSSNPGVTFTDPRRDWSLDSDDRVNTVTAYVDLLKALPKTDIRLSYDLSDGKVTYVYGITPEGAPILFPTTPLQQLAPVENRLIDARLDAQYYLRDNVAMGLGYWFEDYEVNDLSLNPTTLNALNIGTSTIYSGYMYRPYTAHSVSLRVTYLW